MMQAAKAADAPAAQVVGKKQLCEILRWSRPTLDARIERDSAFPIHTRGGKGGGWGFDVGDVQRYLSGASGARMEQAPAADYDDEAEVIQFQPQGRTTQTRGEETASARHKSAQAALMEDRLRKARAELVEAADVSNVLEELMIQLRSELTNMPDVIGREMDLSDRTTALMKRHVESALRNVVRSIRLKLTESAQPVEMPTDA